MSMWRPVDVMRLLAGRLNGRSSIFIARAVWGTPCGPLEEAPAVRARRVLCPVGVGRPPCGRMGQNAGRPVGRRSGPGGCRHRGRLGHSKSPDAFARRVEGWCASIIRFRCSPSPEQLRRHLSKEQQDWLSAGVPWRCHCLQFEVGVFGFENLAGARAARLKNMPTQSGGSEGGHRRSIAAGRDATRDSATLQRYLSGQVR